MNKNNYCVIMAGGVGSRFWPLSKKSKPKQFIDILGTGRTFIQETFDRFVKICPTENIYIVSSIDYKDIILEQLPEVDPNKILLEPARKNTAPCIAYACYKIVKENKDAKVIVAPSDHVITRLDEFLAIIQTGLKFITQNNSLLTLGIKPSRPETGYGYIQISSKDKESENPIKKVKTFTEKPNVELAKVFLESGEFFWNSGIFIWSVQSILDAFENHLPEVNFLFKNQLNKFNTDEEMQAIESIYSECTNISIDYGIMEKAGNVYVLCSDFGWSDLGTWGSLYEHSETDNFGNAINAGDVFIYDTFKCIINAQSDKILVVQGLTDYIIADSDKVLLICKKQDEQEIKHYVNDVKRVKGDFYI